MIAIAGPVPNGGRPVAANTTVAAQDYIFTAYPPR